MFQLSLDRSRQLKGNQFINLPHRDSKIPNIINTIDEESQNYLAHIKKYGFAQQDPTDDVIMQGIKDLMSFCERYIFHFYLANIYFSSIAIANLQFSIFSIRAK